MAPPNPARERDTIPSPPFPESEAPAWAAELIYEVRELRGALIATNEELIDHVHEMARMRRSMRELRLAQLTYEHRTIQLERGTAPVIPIRQDPTANG